MAGASWTTCFPTVRALPEVRARRPAAGDVLVDGGIRRGGDIAKAMAMGAKAVLVGRAYAYGLAGAGRRGVVRAIEILRADVVRTMALLGCESTRGPRRNYVEVPRRHRVEHAGPRRPHRPTPVRRGNQGPLRLGRRRRSRSSCCS